MQTHLTVKQAAKLGVSESLIRSWIADGLLPHYRVGAKGRRGRILIDPADLTELLASFRVAGARPAKPAPVKPVRLKHLRPPS